MATVYPTLNGNGYARDIATLADEAFASTVLSRNRQSEIYHGQIISLDWLMKEYNNQPEKLATEAEAAYKELYSRFFDNATVTASVEGPDEGTNIYTLVLEITGEYNGTRFSVFREIQGKNGAVLTILGALNGQQKTELFGATRG